MSTTQKQSIAAFVAGLLCVFGFAPFSIFFILPMALAGLFFLWRNAGSARVAAWLGFCFGFGFFLAGIGWVYVALHDYGAMPLPLAFLATALFAAFLALFPALAGYLQAQVKVGGGYAWVLLMAAVWVAVEWLRGLIFTGFPWLVSGYSQSDSPLAGYAPVLGVYGVSLALAVSAGLLALLWRERASRRGGYALLVLALLWGGGALLGKVAWTQPQGEPFSVALIQGNIAQNSKFDSNELFGTLERYRRLVLASDAQLTVLPETAFPLLRAELPVTLLDSLSEHAKGNDGDVLIGGFEYADGAYYNSVFSLGVAEEQRYRKQHLVPFGEFIPLRPVLAWFINGVLDIPMGDLASGGNDQDLLEVAGQQVAVNICYEDVFGEEIIRSLPQATVLVNVTNDAWYGDSHAAEQHNQIARMRALESGRMMLRATNTGVTSIIRVDGSIQQQLPQHQEAILSGVAQGYQGMTPYVRLGNALVVLLMVMMLAYVRFGEGRSK
ncbi:MAG: apolipoprotein N-acyltransferase [Gallionella sp.]|nr:apolipoprotein N-acyltransferase [Gallionella sp.]